MIDVAELQLEQQAAELTALATGDDVQLDQFRPWIISIERDIRIYLHPPFPRAVTDELQKIITVFVEHIADDLAFGPGAIRRPVSVPTKLKRLQGDGEDILDDIESYAQLADHYYDDDVKQRRKSRPSYEVSDEVDAISNKAKKLKKSILKYLQELERSITEASAPGETEN